jgi:hypothetical protein
MREITVDNITFKVKEYLSYMDLDKLNMFGLYRIQQKFNLITGGEDITVWQEKFSKGEIELSDADSEVIQKLMEETIYYYRKIDELLIVEPKFIEQRPTVIAKLKQDDRYIAIMKGVIEDIQSILTQGQTTSKNG